MKYLECNIPDKSAYIIPIGDVHYEDEFFTNKSLTLLKSYLDWVKGLPNARIFLMGDLFNCAGRNSKTSPHCNNKTNGFKDMSELLEPYKEKIIGAIDGNHEARIIDDYNMNPLQHLCLNLKIPYCGWSALLKLRVGKRNKSCGNRYHNVYHVYFHHSTGGGATIGGKLNRVEKLRNIVEGVDVFCGGHNHLLASAPLDVYYPADRSIGKRRIWFVDCGGYLEWGGYVEKSMLAPSKLGSPRIRFEGEREHHDVHVSL